MVVVVVVVPVALADEITPATGTPAPTATPSCCDRELLS